MYHLKDGEGSIADWRIELVVEVTNRSSVGELLEQYDMIDTMDES